MRLCTALVPILLLACVQTVLAQEPQPAPLETPAPPVFRVGIEAVQVDVFVADADGNPVAGLTRDDFEIFEDGRPQAIVTFGSVHTPIEPVDPAYGPVDVDVASNMLPEGRLYVFALDEVRAPYALRTRQFLRSFIEQHFGANDLGAVVIVGRGLATDGQDFTRSRTRLLAAIDKFSGGFESGGSNRLASESGQGSSWPGPDTFTTQAYREHLRINRLVMLRALVEQLANIPGRRKALVYVSHGLEVDMYDIVDYSGPARTLDAFCRLPPHAGRMVMSCRPSQDAHAMLAAAHRGNVVFYPVDPRGLMIDAAEFSDLGALAAATGGVAVVNTNRIQEMLERSVRESGSYYMLGFESSHVGRAGRFVPLEVRVKRPGVQVRVRGGSIMPFPEEREALDQSLPHSSAVDAIASIISVPAVSMRAFAAPYKGDGSRAVVPLVVDIDASTLNLVWRAGGYEGTFELRYLATDARSRIHEDRRYPATVSVAAGPGGGMPPGTIVRVLSRLELAPGTYQVRVAAGTEGQAGSVIADLDVPNFTRGALVMSGVAMASAADADVLALRAADPLREALPGTPTTRRSFERSDDLALYLEVYENGSRLAPHTITVKVELRQASEVVLPMIAERRASTEATRPNGGHPFQVHLPLRDVPPGRYVLHVEAESDAQRRPAVVSRAIPIEVR